MRRKVQSGTLAAIMSAVLIVGASPSFGAPAGGSPGGGANSGSGSAGTGDIFADLVVSLRDVHGVPVLKPFAVVGETGLTTEYCVQPVSYAALPGLSDDYRTVNEADGREVYRIPLAGETFVLGVAPDDELGACDVQLAYAMYVKEAELERLNMAREPDEVQARKLAEVAIRLSTADTITLDAAGRITTDGVPIDASPDHAAIFASLMSTGTIPGLDASPAYVLGFDAWMLAAAAVGTAASKTVPLTIDSVEYYNRIVGVPAEHVPSADWTVNFLQAASPGGELFVDYSAFSYTRSDVYQGCVTWLDVPSLTWKVSRVADVVDFAALPPVALDTNGNGIADTVDDVAGFAQLADDVRAVISYLHENEVIAGFYMDPVNTNSCDSQLAALTTPAVKWGALPTELIQTDTVPVTASVYVPWAGPSIGAAQLRLTVGSTDPAQSFTDATQVTAVATDGDSAGQAMPFTVVDGTLVGRWGPPEGFPVGPGYSATTTFDVTVAAGAPTGTYALTLELVDLAAGEAVLAADSASTDVLDAALTALWTSVTEYAAEGTFVPATARLFNPDLGGSAAGQADVTGAQLRITIDAPEPFVMASQVAAWSDAVSMAFSLDANGNLTGMWGVPDPIPVPYDQLTTWYLNVAEGAPIGLYAITVDILDAGGVPLSSDVAEVTLALAATQEGGSGGGSGGGGGGTGDGTLPPVAAITDGPAVVTSDTSATFTLTADQDGVSFLCALDGAVASACSSPVTYNGLADGSHTFAVSATGGAGKVGPTAIWSWTVEAVAPTDEVGTDPEPGATTPEPALPTTPVYRFWSPLLDNAHFFTTSEEEAALIRADDTSWIDEGTAFSSYVATGGTCAAGTTAIHRFYSQGFRSHFYTASDEEKASILLNDTNWAYEGVAFCASSTLRAGTTAVYRFWSPRFGKHFYTAGLTEAQQLDVNDPNWDYEGIAYYVVP